mmetsp:Transcript_5815/g.14002  ORF Transcript_5815/g.14002 Transcript_5815/m.14002 type:complete len:255 (+) Transcript_5815:1043-1807(+)
MTMRNGTFSVTLSEHRFSNFEGFIMMPARSFVISLVKQQNTNCGVGVGRGDMIFAQTLFAHGKSDFLLYHGLFKVTIHAKRFSNQGMRCGNIHVVFAEDVFLDGQSLAILLLGIFEISLFLQDQSNILDRLDDKKVFFPEFVFANQLCSLILGVRAGIISTFRQHVTYFDIRIGNLDVICPQKGFLNGQSLEQILKRFVRVSHCTQYEAYALISSGHFRIINTVCLLLETQDAPIELQGAFVFFEFLAQDFRKE